MKFYVSIQRSHTPIVSTPFKPGRCQVPKKVRNYSVIFSCNFTIPQRRVPKELTVWVGPIALKINFLLSYYLKISHFPLGTRLAYCNGRAGGRADGRIYL